MSKKEQEQIIQDLEDITNRLEVNNSYNQLIYDYINKGNNEFKNDNDYILYCYEMQRHKESYINLLNEMFETQKNMIEKLNQTLDVLIK